MLPRYCAARRDRLPPPPCPATPFALYDRGLRGLRWSRAVDSVLYNVGFLEWVEAIGLPLYAILYTLILYIYPFPCMNRMRVMCQGACVIEWNETRVCGSAYGNIIRRGGEPLVSYNIARFSSKQISLKPPAVGLRGPWNNKSILIISYCHTLRVCIELFFLRLFRFHISQFF